MKCFTSNVFLVIASLLVMSYPVKAQTYITYDPSLGTLPEQQNLVRVDNGLATNPSIAGNIFFQDTTNNLGARQWWYSTADFNSMPINFIDGFTMEINLWVISSGYNPNIGNGNRRAGYEVGSLDNQGRYLSINITSTGIWLDYSSNSTANGGTVFTPFDSTTGFNNYRLISQGNTATLYINGSLFLTTPLGGIVDSGPSGAFFGENTAAEGSQTQLSLFRFSSSAVPFPTSITLSPNPVTGGVSGTGTVALAFAPAVNTTVALSSSNPAVTVPASVNVSAGSTTASFNFASTAVLADTPVIVSSSLNQMTKQSSIIVTPEKLVSIKVSPISVVGGKSAAGTISLSTLAPTGGYTVALISANSDIVSVPSSVTVPAGSKIVKFPISTYPTNENANIAISASFGGSTKSASLTVAPPNILSVTLKPNPVVGGNSVIGTVKLTGIAPSAGVFVNLTSSVPSIASVPASISAPAGATSISFTITTIPVSTNVTIEINAQCNGVSKSANLTVKPPVISSLKLLPSIVKGGVQNSTGTVTLTGIAPVGDMVVTLSSSDVTAATVPATVTVPAGSKTATFPITSQTVIIQKKPIVSATTGLISKLATLTVNP